MTVPGNSALLLALLAAFVACTGYAGGRLHQWYRMGQDRDDAYRDGYDTATRSVFTLAARVISPRKGPGLRGTAAVTLPASAVTDTAAGKAGRHTVPDELVQAPTYRLAPDRVARAKVHGALSPDEFEPVEDAHKSAVPKPRSS